MLKKDMPRIVENGKVGQIDATKVPRFSGPATFARLPEIDDVSDVDVAIVGIPFDTGVTYRPGARFGPTHVRQSSRLIRPYNPAVDVSPLRRTRLSTPVTWRSTHSTSTRHREYRAR